MKTMRRLVICPIVILFLVAFVFRTEAQDPLRFEKEVEKVTSVAPTNKKDIIVFTGSSTIRMWKDIQTYFPSHNILNRGFGGSQTSDLIYYAEKLIVQYKPSQIFVYEGDNDLGSGKSKEVILQDSQTLVEIIRSKLGSVPVVFITPKPSKARWHLKENYERYIEDLKRWAKTQKGVTVADLWTPMLDEDGIVMQDIFLEDGLHMNKKGYDIWAKAIGPLLR
jgi:lysophospholipase L1-like esterase